MAHSHRTVPRPLVAVVLSLALLVGSLARADAAAPEGRSRVSKWIITPALATVAFVVVVALVQAARAPSRDVRRPDRALNSVDRALAAARGDGAYSTRWKAPPKLGPARATLAAVGEPVVKR